MIIMSRRNSSPYSWWNIRYSFKYIDYIYYQYTNVYYLYWKYWLNLSHLLCNTYILWVSCIQCHSLLRKLIHRLWNVKYMVLLLKLIIHGMRLKIMTIIAKGYYYYYKLLVMSFLWQMLHTRAISTLYYITCHFKLFFLYN